MSNEPNSILTDASPEIKRAELLWADTEEQRWLQGCGMFALIRDVLEHRTRSDREIVRLLPRRTRSFRMVWNPLRRRPDSRARAPGRQA